MSARGSVLPRVSRPVPWVRSVLPVLSPGSVSPRVEWPVFWPPRSELPWVSRPVPRLVPVFVAVSSRPVPVFVRVWVPVFPAVLPSVLVLV